MDDQTIIKVNMATVTGLAMVNQYWFMDISRLINDPIFIKTKTKQFGHVNKLGDG